MEPLAVLLVATVLVIATSAVAPKIGLSAPLALVIVGTAISLLPFIPPIEIEPEFILVFILPPLLYAAAAAMPTMELRRDFGVISGFAFALVAITAIALGFLFSWLIPGLGLPAGIAFGAIVSPTDAVAIKIAERIGIPARLGAVLNGEVLLNDASALVIMKSALVAIAGTYSLGGIFGSFLWSVVGATLIGGLVGIFGLMARRRIGSPALSTAVSLLLPYIAFLPAEHLGVSGLVAAVAAGLVTGHRSLVYLSARERIFDHTIWTTVETMMEGSVFFLMGLELRALFEDVHGTYSQIMQAIGLGFLTVIALLAIRAAFLVPVTAGLRRASARRAANRHRLEWMEQRLADVGTHPEPRLPPTTEIRALGSWGTPARDVIYRRPTRFRMSRRLAFRLRRAKFTRRLALWLWPRQARHGHHHHHSHVYSRFTARISRAIADTDYFLNNPIGSREGLLLVFAGMRGVVTLAAAQSLPHTFPNRSFIVFVAFLVAFISLLGQGSLLPVVVRQLGFADTTNTGSEDARLIHLNLERVAAEFLDDASLVRPDGQPYDPDIVTRVRAHFLHPETEFPGQASEDASDYQASYRELWARAVNHQREQLISDREIGLFESAPLEAALTAIDAEELMIQMKPAAWLVDD